MIFHWATLYRSKVMVIFIWISLIDSQVGHMCWSCCIARYSYNAVWRCRFSNAFWPLHKQSRGTVLTHIDGVRANLFSINPRQENDLHCGKSTVVLCFVVVVFHVKLDATISFPSNTTEVRPIYLKMGHIMRKPVFVIYEQQRRRSACASTQSDQRFNCSLPW